MVQRPTLGAEWAQRHRPRSVENTTTGGGGHTINLEQGVEAELLIRRARGPLTIQVQMISQVEVVSSSGPAPGGR